ncbi:hypothetical protein [Faecalimicrobium sp. JNUCC 81]
MKNYKNLVIFLGGTKKFKIIVRDFKEVIEKHNLQCTPTILRDLIEEILTNHQI